jgi:[methyl-Co(III) methanol-specific corrinoid protein]:coenzyme M methyltransferase
MKDKMTPRERVLAAFQLLPYDRIPVISPVSAVIRESMSKTSCFFPQAHYDAAKMASLAAAGHDIIGFDCVSPYFGVCNEAAALGCNVNWGNTEVFPSIRSHINYHDLNVNPDTEYICKKPIKAVLEAIRLPSRVRL